MEDAMLGRIAGSLIVASVTFGCAESGPKVVGADDARMATGQLPANQALLTLPAGVSQDTALKDPRPVTAAEQFDHALRRMVDNEAVEPLAVLPADERELLGTVIDAIAGFRNTLADSNALMATRTAPLVALSQQLESQLPLEIPTLVLCKSVQQFGIYESIDAARLPESQATPVIVYCELSHFRSKLNSEARWETKLSYEAVLRRDGEESAIMTKKPTMIVDHCRNRRRDFFLADRMTIPSNLKAGNYQLKVTVVDQLANRVAEKTLPIVVASQAE
jgi:hypothetical protein